MSSRTRVELGLRADLGGDCANCVGLCCVALAFARSADFAYDKPAGEPCRNLDEQDACRVHSELRPNGFKGCTVFDCFGAGQKVTQQTFAGTSWRSDPDIRAQMFAVFPIVRRLHELLWYLDRALALQVPSELAARLSETFDHVERISDAEPDRIRTADVDREFDLARPLLIEASQAARSRDRTRRGKQDQHGAPRRNTGRNAGRGRVRAGVDLIAADLRDIDLRTQDLRGALLIAADLRGADLELCDVLGADLRDADVRGARLEHAIFLTQMQVNAARGDARTTLPVGFSRPSHWG